MQTVTTIGTRPAATGRVKPMESIMLKFEVTEATKSELATNSKSVEWYEVPTGTFVGQVFVERTTSGVVEKDVIAEIAANPDRDLVERRTKAIFDVLSRDY